MISLFLINPISKLWIEKSHFLTITSNLHNANFIIFEQNGDPIHSILHIKSQIPPNLHHKLFFILSGDQNSHIDDFCNWYTCAIKPSGLSRFQRQIFVTNPSIFRYSNPIKPVIDLNKKRNIDIYFKGSIWHGMRTQMKEVLEIYPNVMIEDFTSYWDWRFEKNRTEKEIEEKAFELYDTLTNVKLSLCPKGKGNSSMRIIESIACGAVPVLIDDFSAPYGFDYSQFCLVFDSKSDSFESIYESCMEFINNESKYKYYQKRGYEFYQNIVCCDFKKNYYDYHDINTILYGSSTFLIHDLIIQYFQEKNKFYDFRI